MNKYYDFNDLKQFVLSCKDNRPLNRNNDSLDRLIIHFTRKILRKKVYANGFFSSYIRCSRDGYSFHKRILTKDAKAARFIYDCEKLHSYRQVKELLIKNYK